MSKLHSNATIKILGAFVLNAINAALVIVNWRAGHSTAAALLGVVLVIVILLEVGSLWSVPRPAGAPLTFTEWEQQRDDTRRAAMANPANPAAKGLQGRRRQS